MCQVYKHLIRVISFLQEFSEVALSSFIVDGAFYGSQKLKIMKWLNTNHKQKQVNSY